MRIIVTGAAGFIGMQTALRLLNPKNKILGIDNLNNYYDRNLKLKRLNILKKYRNFKFKKIDIADRNLFKVFKSFKPDYVIHLAAQAGVRHSLSNPQDYTHSNLLGFANVLEFSKLLKIKHLIYASSSSVYGEKKDFPLSEKLKLDKPISYYGATKLCNELMAYSYSHLFKLPTTGLRFFTAYGPWGRPDMALFLFTVAIKKRKKIQLYNRGDMIRDFTYIDDITISIKKLLKKKPNAKNSTPHRILNIGSSNPIKLKKYVGTLEKILNVKSNKMKLPMQKGDIRHTQLVDLIKFKPKTKITDGIKNFIDWFDDYYAS